MATTAREGTNLSGKEKRGVSPSPLQHHHVKKTPATKSSTPSAQKTSSATTSPAPTSDKPIPNYLKPTISSSLDSSRIHNNKSSSSRSSTDASAQKPILNRRRSFDKPPSPARLQKSIHGATAITSSSNKPALRSTSFRSSALADRSKNASPSSASLLRSRSSVKKTTASSSSAASGGGGASKKDLRTDVSKRKGPKSVTSDSSVDGLESHDRQKELGADADHFHVSEDEGITDMIDHVHEVQSLPDISEMPGHKYHLADPLTTTEAHVEVEEDSSDGHYHDNVHDVDQEKLTPLSQDDDNNNIAEQKTEPEPEAAAAEEQDKTTKPAAGEDDERNNQNEDKQDDEAIHDNEDDHPAKAEQGKDEKPAENVTDGEEKKDEDSSIVEVKKDEVQETGPEGACGKDEAVVDSVIQQAKAAVETQNNNYYNSSTDTSGVMGSKPGAGRGKKDQQAAVSNDVIEETSKKLMDQNRRNKVKALAGAFETVISLQDTKN